MAAVLSCGPEAVLSHGSAAALWGFGVESRGRIEVTIRSGSGRRRPGIRISRRPGLTASEISACKGIPVTDPVRTLIDLAAMLSAARLERCVNEADRLDLVDPEELRTALNEYVGVPGVARLRELLDRRTFRFTRSNLERRFRPLAAAAGLPAPQTRQWLNGFEVDFWWPELGLVVETDGLRYHRTPAQQARDRLRDQAHTAAGFTQLRFTHEQIRYEPRHVIEVLTKTIAASKGTNGEFSTP
jgi:very-short-patch-repair endonuclease